MFHCLVSARHGNVRCFAQASILISIWVVVNLAPQLASVAQVLPQAVPKEKIEALVENRMTPELLWKLGRLGEAAVSRDGQTVAYTINRFDMAKNSGTTDLHLLELKSGKDIAIIENWNSISSIQWHGENGKSRIYFEGSNQTDDSVNQDRPANGDTDVPPADDELANGNSDLDGTNDAALNQAWYLDLKTRATVQVTSIEDGISNLKVSPDGKRLAFTARVKMKLAPNELYPDLPKADARIIDGLMYRHWNKWDDYQYSHIFVSVINGKGCCGETFDLMKGIQADCPVPPFGGAEQFTWSPDGKSMAFTMKNVSDWAHSTNSDVYVVKAAEDETPVNISEGMLGYDLQPNWSPDGKSIAFLSMERGGFESDRSRVMLFNRQTKSIKELTAGLDQNAHAIRWLGDSSAILFTSEVKGTEQVFRVDVSGKETENEIVAKNADVRGLTQLTQGRFNWSIADVVPGGRFLLLNRMDMLQPRELFLLDTQEGGVRALTNINEEVYSTLELPKVEERLVTATDGEKIHSWVIYPPGFDPKSKKKWPLLVYCQGGPQSQVGQWFSYRWNFHLMAAKGYIVIAPNRRGLPGFGQKWNDQISKDWGGQAMQDLLSATDSMVSELYVDKSKVAAVGASFGGYSVYWLMGHHQNRFSAMIAHCGVFNLESMYGSTEELFFVDWDMGGPYWKSDAIKQRYDRFSPHQFVKNWDTPLLVVHGQKDFRVPVTQGMEAFTAAQVNNVPSRFLYFPDEGHWVQSPQNSVLWHRVFFDWLERYCPPQRDRLQKTLSVKRRDSR